EFHQTKKISRDCCAPYLREGKHGIEVRTAFVMGEEEIPDRKFNALIDLQIANGSSDLKNDT
ncbi:unnamed protein product, partial [Porites lobata]